MYISGAVLAVPRDNRSNYQEMAESMAQIFLDSGALETMDAWEDDVASGEQTDFRRAVAAEEGEDIVFSWIIWPDKQTAQEAEAKMVSDPRLAELGAMPFGGKRMIFGGFTPLVTNRQA